MSFYKFFISIDRKIIHALGCPSKVNTYLDATHGNFNMASPRASNRDICAGIVVLNSHYSLVKKERSDAKETNQQEDQADGGRS